MLATRYISFVSLKLRLRLLSKISHKKKVSMSVIEYQKRKEKLYHAIIHTDIKVKKKN